jgi:hypothetical protein
MAPVGSATTPLTAGDAGEVFELSGVEKQSGASRISMKSARIRRRTVQDLQGERKKQINDANDKNMNSQQ